MFGRMFIPTDSQPAIATFDEVRDTLAATGCPGTVWQQLGNSRKTRNIRVAETSSKTDRPTVFS
jgi:hypothetical protein